MNHTAIIGSTNTSGVWRDGILAVVEDENLPMALEQIVQAFLPYFDQKMDDKRGSLSFDEKMRIRASRAEMFEALDKQDWMGVITAYKKSRCRGDYSFYFSPVQVDPEDEDIVKAVVLSGWAAKHYDMKEGSEKDAIQKAVDESRWSDALEGLAKLNADNA